MELAARVFGAGAGMTAVMLACYPDVFKKGAIMSGCPYKSASNATQALNAMQGFVTNTAQNWGNLVTAAYPGYTGPYPAVAEFHGSADNVVNIVNQGEIMNLVDREAAPAQGARDGPQGHCRNQ